MSYSQPWGVSFLRDLSGEHSSPGQAAGRPGPGVLPRGWGSPVPTDWTPRAGLMHSLSCVLLIQRPAPLEPQLSSLVLPELPLSPPVYPNAAVGEERN